MKNTLTYYGILFIILIFAGILQFFGYNNETLFILSWVIIGVVALFWIPWIPFGIVSLFRKIKNNKKD